MRHLASIIVGTMLLTSSPVGAASRPSPEAKLAKALEGRVAGEPIDCVNLHNIRSSTIIDGTAILYKAGNTVYVNYPRSGRESLNQWDALVTRTPSTRLCSIDVVQTVDLQSRMMTGLVFLGEFVPYRKVKAAD
ncbi:MAG: hypothetical protein H0W74_05860 [Sphingosinicella sp.]|nr:hypothetical protein [Sphingosinicella sp.]